MAVKSEDQGSETTISTTKSKRETQGNPMHNPIASILDSMLKTSAMDESAKAHFSQLMDALKRDPAVKSEDYPMSSYESRLVYTDNTKQGVILIYDASYEASAPLSTKSGEILGYVKARKPDVQILTDIIIIPQDYPRVQILAKNVGALVSQARSALQTTAEHWAQYGQLVVTNKMGQIFDIISKNYPHSVYPRCDYGCAIYVAPNDQQCKKLDGSWDYDKLVPVAAITAYTKMIPAPDAAGLKFQPLPNITGIIPAIPNPSMLALCIPIAIDRFISCKDWVNSIRSYGPRVPNLGNLIPDTNGQMLGIQNDQQRNEFIQKFTLGEYIAFDVVGGLFGIPGRERLVSTASITAKNKLKEYFAGFLGVDSSQLVGEITRGEFNSNIGYVEGIESDYVQKNSTVDSRYIDYMTMAISIKDPAILNQLHDQNPNPAMRKALIKGWYPSYRELFSCKTVVFDPNFANIMRGVLVSRLAGRVQYDVDQAQVFIQNSMINTIFNLGGNSASPFAGSNIGGIAGQGFTTDVTIFE